MLNTTDLESATIDEIHKNVNVRITASQKLTSKVKPNDLLVDYSYQRETLDTKVNAIIRNFNAKAIGVVILSIRDNGDLYIIDGAHRIEAMKRMNMGNLDVNAIVYFNLSLKDEADLFVLLNNNRTKPKRSALQKAAAMAGHENAVELNSVLEKVGLAFGDKPGDGIVRAIATANKVLNRLGKESLENSLIVLMEGFGSHSSSFSAELIEAISMILAKYPNADKKRLAKVLREMGDAQYVVAKAKNAVGNATFFVKIVTLALSIVDVYNKSLRSNRLDRSMIALADPRDY